MKVYGNHARSANRTDQGTRSPDCPIPEHTREAWPERHVWRITRRSRRAKVNHTMPNDRFVPLEAATFLPDGPAATSVAGAIRSGNRVFLSGRTALRPDGAVAGLGDAAAQTHAALDNIEAALAAAGGSLHDITKLTTSLVDRAHREVVYDTIGRRLKDVFPVSTGLIVAGLSHPELMVQIDAEAVVGTAVPRLRTFELKDWFGQNIAWQGAMVAAGPQDIFIRGQTGATLDGSAMAGPGRRPEDAEAQAELALTNLATLLHEAGCGMEDVSKITVYISDRAYRAAVYPVIGRHFRGIHPVSTGIIVPGFARADILFEIDVQAMRPQGGPHQRTRRYHSNAVRYGVSQQNINCDFCMAVRAGPHVVLRGQTGTDLNEVMHGLGDPPAQAEQAMQNVAALLGEAGARLADVTKAIVFVTDRAYLTGVTNVVLRHLGPAAPCLSTLIVKGLASPDLSMEVDITAMVQGDDA
jgi:enamine deaminase RidA (YjgF/YER057c/UK114 family)